MAKAQRAQFATQAGLELRPGAEQSQRRLHLQQQDARVMHADLGAEPIGPGGQEALPIVDLRRIVRRSDEIAAEHIGGGQGLPRLQAQRARCRVDCLQHPALHGAGYQDKRLLGFGALAQHGIEGQLRQENAGPQHGDLKRN